MNKGRTLVAMELELPLLWTDSKILFKLDNTSCQLWQLQNLPKSTRTSSNQCREITGNSVQIEVLEHCKSKSICPLRAHLRLQGIHRWRASTVICTIAGKWTSKVTSTHVRYNGKSNVIASEKHCLPSLLGYYPMKYATRLQWYS